MHKFKMEIKNNVSKIVLIGLLSITGIGIMVVLFAPYLSSYQKNPDYLNNLPERPDDFLYWKNSVAKGYIVDVCDIDESYWKHPDFYPNWDFAEERYYKSHDYSRWGTFGFGSYPGYGMKVSNMKEGDEIVKCVFFKASPNVETYQGVKLSPITNQYFDLEIIGGDNPSFPNTILLEPTFPEYSREWVKKVKVIIRANQDVPAGHYQLGFMGTYPENEFSRLVTEEILRKGVENNLKYVEECKTEMKSRGYNEFIDNCERYMWERQNRYYAGGSVSSDLNTWTLTLEVVRNKNLNKMNEDEI